MYQLNLLNMKKLLILTVILANLAGCKKGENDPFLSFRSRDGRIIGEWTISNYNYSETQKNGNTTTNVEVTYAGSTYTSTKSSGNPPADATEYSYTLKIDEGGKVTLTTTTKNGNQTGTFVEEGTWIWGTNNKNKSAIMLAVAGDQSNRNYFSGGMFNLDQLKNKEVILTRSTNSSSKTSGAAGIDQSFQSNTTVTLTQ